MSKLSKELIGRRVEEAFQLRVYSSSVDSDHKIVSNSARYNQGAQQGSRKHKQDSILLVIF